MTYGVLLRSGELTCAALGIRNVYTAGHVRQSTLSKRFWAGSFRVDELKAPQ